MKKTKRLLSLLMAVSLCLTLLLAYIPPIRSRATTDSGTCGDNLTWEYSDGTLYISGSGSMYDYEIEYDVWAEPGFEYYSTAPWTSYSVERVVISDGVTSIGENAFYDGYKLTSVTIGNSVTSIGIGAFTYCNNLTDISIPDSITWIPSSAFIYCSKLTYNCYSQGKYLGNAANPYVALLAATGTEITGCTIHPDTKLIADEAFRYCDSLNSVTIPDSVVAIGEYAFSDCTGLTRVTIPDRGIAIGDQAFNSCPKLAYHIYDQGKYLGNDANPYIALVDTMDKSITGCTIHPYTKVIGVSAFSNCASLASITIPEGITYIGGRAFYGCDQLRSVYFVGDAPIFGISRKLQNLGESPPIYKYVYYGPFAYVAATAYYRSGASGWDAVTAEDLSGTGHSWISQFNKMTMVGEDHIVPEYVYDQNATCTADGTERGICLCCGAVVIRRAEGTAGAHQCSYVSNNDATCTTDGTKTGKCVLCGIMDTVPDPGTALGHAYTDYVSDQNATCTADGTKTKRCLRCSITETVPDSGSARGHAYTDYVSDQNATCTTDGTKTKICAACGATETVTDVGSATGHSFTNYIPDNNYTCTADGTKTAKCDYCDVMDVQTDIGSMAHRYFEGYCVYCGEGEVNLASICGSVTAFGQGAVLLELVSESGDGISRLVSDSTYRLEGIKPGNYTLTVSQTGSVTRSYSLTLDEGEHTQDLKLHLPGDINGDGRYNIGDVARIYAHVKSSTPLTGYELLCADYTGDGRVTVGDTARVYYILKGN